MYNVCETSHYKQIWKPNKQNDVSECRQTTLVPS